MQLIYKHSKELIIGNLKVELILTNLIKQHCQYNNVISSKLLVY